MLVPLSFNRRPGEVRRCRASSTPVAPGRGQWHEPEPTRWPPALRAGALPSELSCRAAARAGTSRRRPDSNRWVSALQADGSPAASHLHRQCACARTSGPGGAPGEIRTPTPRRDLVYSQAGQPIAQPTRVREGVSGPCRSFRPAVFHCPRGAGARVPGGTACSPPGEPRAHPDQARRRQAGILSGTTQVSTVQFSPHPGAGRVTVSPISSGCPGPGSVRLRRRRGSRTPNRRPRRPLLCPLSYSPLFRCRCGASATLVRK